ncbi:hypothetical protein SprV_0100356700 [Sparganum proliferum]
MLARDPRERVVYVTAPKHRFVLEEGNREKFGRDALRTARSWELFSTREAATYEQLRFLHRCLRDELTPRCLRYKAPVNTAMGREVVRRFVKQMTRVLIDDCHRRLQKYKAEIEKNRRQCVHILGDPISSDLGKTISALAHHRQAKKRDVLERKLTKLKPPGTESSNLVHNLSSKHLTEQQLRVLRHETCFNTADADPVDFIAALEAMLLRSETSDDMKHSVRQRVTSLLMTHRPTRCISQSVSKAMNELRRDDSIIILPADKRRSTVEMNREDYNEKAKALLDDREFYRPAQKSQAKAVADRPSKLLREY